MDKSTQFSPIPPPRDSRQTPRSDKSDSELSGGVDPPIPLQKPVTYAPSFVTIISLDEERSRENWSGRLDFLLSCIGFAVGLGNIWRFPYLCYKSGGGAFLIPYTFFLITCGFPLFFLEVSYGQFASLSPIAVWRICPLFRGIGYGMVIISAIVCIYYNVIIAWDFYFLYMSVSKVLPWTLCDQYWNTEDCVVERTKYVNNASTMKLYFSIPKNNSILASVEFWERHVLQMTDGIEHFGTVRWPLVICLVLAWFIVFLCLSKGIKSSGKVVYVTATFPYFVLLILLVRGVTLPGAIEGIKFYVIPKWYKLQDLKVWGDAAVQIFYSVGMAWGSLITMASYNKFNHNVFKDAMVVPLVNCGTSVFAGFVIFSTLGFMAETSGVPIQKVVSQGPGLTFVAYPEAVAKMPFSQLWAVLFFLMIFTVGVDSQFGMFETITSAFIDEYPHILRKRKIRFTAAMCVMECVLGVPLVFQGGVYLLQIIDWYSATFSLMIICVIECVVISWIYGIERFVKDIELMLGHKPFALWKYMWKYITPSLILRNYQPTIIHNVDADTHAAVKLWNKTKMKTIQHLTDNPMFYAGLSYLSSAKKKTESNMLNAWENFTIVCHFYSLTYCFSVGTLEPVSIKSYKFPKWAISLGWCLGLFSILPLPIQAILGIKREKSGTFCQRVKKLSQPSYNWGPALEEDKMRYVQSMTLYERERFEAAHFMLDRDRYLAMRNLNELDEVVSINLEPTDDLSVVQRLTLLTEAANYYNPEASQLTLDRRQN